MVLLVELTTRLFAP